MSYIIRSGYKERNRDKVLIKCHPNLTIMGHTAVHWNGGFFISFSGYLEGRDFMSDL
jgi:hypothetical protein